MRHDSEVISEQIKSRIDPIPKFDLVIQTVDNREIIILDISRGLETPYYYVSEGTRTAYQRVENESIPVDARGLKELILRGIDSTYDSSISRYEFENYSFTKLKAAYKQRTGENFDEDDFISFGIVSEEGKLTNAGALLADESPIRHSRLFCTRWNGVDKAAGTMDALDDKEFTGSLVVLLENGLDFVRTNSKVKWKKTGEERIELPDYPRRSVLEGLVNALIHRQYLDLGSEVHIDIFDDRLEIYSPGGMCDGSFIQERDINKIPSKRRNPVIADIFNRLKYMERRGSGFKKIQSVYQSQYLYTDRLSPQFYSDKENFILTLKNLNYEGAEKGAEKMKIQKMEERKEKYCH